MFRLELLNTELWNLFGCLVLLLLVVLLGHDDDVVVIIVGPDIRLLFVQLLLNQSMVQFDVSCFLLADVA